MSSRRRRAVHDQHHINKATSDQVWRLLLENPWQDPELQVVSKLLCCSSEMVKLVHSTCEGRVKLKLVSRHRTRPKSSKTEYQQWLEDANMESSCWGRWLAKHGRLVCALDLIIWPEQDAVVAAGLRAAAGSAGTLSSSRATRSQTRLSAAAEAAAADGPSTSKQGLLLQQLLFSDVPSQALLLSTACSTLRGLVAPVPPRFGALQQQAQALAHLTSLQQLFLISQSTSSFSQHCQAIQHLKQLKQLVLFNMDDAPLRQQDISALPPSLQQLHTAVGCTVRAGGLNYSHLRQLKHLSLPWIEEGLLLPPSVTHVEALGCLDVAPLVSQPHLRSARLWLCSFEHEQLQQLAAATHLQELHLGFMLDADELLVGVLDNLNLPMLRSLECVDGVITTAAVDALHKFSPHLDSLMLVCRQLDANPRHLTAALSKMTRLQQLAVMMPLQYGPAAGRDPEVALLSGLAALGGRLPPAGCQYLMSLAGLLRVHSHMGPPSADEYRFAVQCFGSRFGTSLLGLLARSTWSTFLRKQPREGDAAAAAGGGDVAAAAAAVGGGGGGGDLEGQGQVGQLLEGGEEA